MQMVTPRRGAIPNGQCHKAQQHQQQQRQVYSNSICHPHLSHSFLRKATSPTVGWNIFDLCLVLVSFIDVASAVFTRASQELASPGLFTARCGHSPIVFPKWFETKAFGFQF